MKIKSFAFYLLFFVTFLEAGKEKKDAFMQAAARDFGKDFGTGALTTVGTGSTAAFASGKVAVGGSITAAGVKAKAAAIAIYAHPWGLPVVAGTVIAGGAYKTYQHYNPSDEEKLRRNNLKIEALASEGVLKSAQKFREIEDTKAELTTCLMKNRKTVEITPSGIPLACELCAFNLTMLERKTDTVDEMTKLFKSFSSNSK